MGRLWSGNSSRTYGPQCPDGHGTLINHPDWGGKLWCASSEHGGNGRFFRDEDVVEGLSPAGKVAIEEATNAALAERLAAKAAERAAVAAKRTARPAAAPRADTPANGPECLCGCGEHTKGGRFRPGHDARYHAAQKKAGLHA